MCGIAAFIGRRKLPQEALDRTLNALRQRGPDASGVWQGECAGHQVSLVHTRLAIIDCDMRSAQPFHDHGVVLTYNGEIYNYRELHDALTQAGETFATTSDTEVLARLLARQGVACLDRLEGMWAFVAVDQSRGEIIISRDRFGEKPLFLWQRPEGLYLASEIKALAAMAGEWPKPDMTRLRRQIVLGYKSLYKQSGSFYEGVTELPPATSLTLGATLHVNAVPYWKLPFAPDEAMTFSDAVEGAREKLIRSMELRLRADVPLAFCLSGGVDSGSLASIAAKKLGAKLTALTIVDDDPRYDEREKVAKVVADIGCDWIQVSPSSKNFMERLRLLVAYHDKPVLTLTSFVEAFLADTIHEAGFKVAITGVAADELFSGYYDHYNFWLAQQARNLPHGSPDMQRLIADWHSTYGRFVRNPELRDLQGYIDNPARRGHVYLGAETYNSFMRERVESDFTETDFGADLLRNRMLNEIGAEIVPIILAESDLNFMRVGVENRSPYLDRALAEFAFTIPTRHLIQNGLPKSVLREAMDTILHDEVRLNPQKQGFNVSLNTLLRDDPHSIDAILGMSSIYDHVERGAVERMLRQDGIDNADAKFLFAVISAGLFLESHSQQA